MADTTSDRTGTPDRGARPDRVERTPNTLLNALIGAAVTVFVFFVPFSPVLGGAVAGYLQGGDGVRVGAISGVFAAIPAALIFLLLFLVGIGLAVGPGRGAIFIVLAFLIVVAFLAAYMVGLSALGGVLGVYLKRDIDF